MRLLIYLYFIIITYAGFHFLFKKQGLIKNPLNKKSILLCDGPELFWILTFSTGLLALSAQAGLDMSAIRLMVLEVLCFIGIFVVKRRSVYSIPLVIYSFYILWMLIGLLYTPSPSFGIRVILKYLYPILITLFASAVVRDKEIVLKAAYGAKWVAIVSMIVFFIPVVHRVILPGVFWTKAASATHYIAMCMFSLALFYHSTEKRKNLLFVIAFILPCIIWVYRTDIMGTALAFASFFLIKYRLKALPIVAMIGLFFMLAIFYIPSVKKKMFFKPDEVSIESYLAGEVSEDNINTSGRKLTWEDAMNRFYKNDKIIGSGTGRLQTFFYTEATDWRRGGQVHNDFIQILCDNGIIGFFLYLLSITTIFIHSFYLYQSKKSTPELKICAITAGASLLGITLTMYSDNTISFSMATLSYPWGFYGMALGLLKSRK